jgi:uncharacterized protein (DUF779 family)
VVLPLALILLLIAELVVIAVLAAVRSEIDLIEAMLHREGGCCPGSNSRSVRYEAVFCM